MKNIKRENIKLDKVIGWNREKHEKYGKRKEKKKERKLVKNKKDEKNEEKKSQKYFVLVVKWKYLKKRSENTGKR